MGTQKLFVAFLSSIKKGTCFLLKSIKARYHIEFDSSLGVWIETIVNLRGSTTINQGWGFVEGGC